MTDEQLAAIQARCVAASDGPWEATDRFPTLVHDGEDGAAVCEVKLFHIGRHRAECNRQFIAHARSDVSLLLDEVARLRQQR